jgi:hypothetical protein
LGRVAEIMGAIMHMLGFELPDRTKMLTLGRANKASAATIGDHIKGIHIVHPASPSIKC